MKEEGRKWESERVNKKERNTMTNKEEKRREEEKKVRDGMEGKISWRRRKRKEEEIWRKVKIHGLGMGRGEEEEGD